MLLFTSLFSILPREFTGTLFEKAEEEAEAEPPEAQHSPRLFHKMSSIGHYTGLGQQILVELNPNILVRDAIRM